MISVRVPFCNGHCPSLGLVAVPSEACNRDPSSFDRRPEYRFVRTVRFSHGDFSLVVQTLDNPAEKRFLSAEIVEDQFAVLAQATGRSSSWARCASASPAGTNQGRISQGRTLNHGGSSGIGRCCATREDLSLPLRLCGTTGQAKVRDGDVTSK